jgi:hypothetical protein
MSTVKATNFQNASSATVNMVTDASGNVSFGGTAAMSSSFLRNRIINGDMRIDQRNAGAAVTVTNAGQYTVDRWQSYQSIATSKFTVQQNAGAVTPPSGFSNYAGCTSSSAYSIGAGEYFVFWQKIEGFNFSDMGWGTAGAKTVTLSFWAYSSLTGTFGGSIQNSAQNRNYNFSYTISSANTWTAISVTIAGDTTGTWVGSTNGIGAQIFFGIGAGTSAVGAANTWGATALFGVTGQVNIIATNGATFYITGVQLEAGTVATPFERQIYSTQLAQCQRYYETTYFSTSVAVPTNASNGYIPIPSAAVASGTQYAFIPFKVTKRASPTVTTYSYTSSTTSKASALNGTDLAVSSGVPAGATASHFWLSNDSGASITPSLGGFLIHYAATSEL